MTTMKPIRSNELEFWTNTINEEFSTKKQIIETEINKDAQTMSEEKEDLMPKQSGVEKDLNDLQKADDEYRSFIRTKDEQERKLHQKVKDIGDRIQTKLERVAKVRNWDIGFSWDSREDGAEYFYNKLKTACYDECYKIVRDDNKVYNELKQIKTACKIILNTGGDINTTVTALKEKMAEAKINLPIPKQMLQLSK
jgi:predicted  nucleic acid-binding Zn-ribbon protein|tara:strand:- start:6 stop:593 length:588 start_codon:yes stop_codon:yes gene_type:complete